MKHLRWIVAACFASWALVLTSGQPAAETFFGMLGPLVAVIGTCAIVERTHRAAPERVGSVLMGAFAAKMVFFGAYVVLVTRLWNLELRPFAASFVAYFVALYVVQAMLVRGLTVRQAS
jgi:hypothetical protein